MNKMVLLISVAVFVVVTIIYLWRSNTGEGLMDKGFSPTETQSQQIRVERLDISQEKPLDNKYIASIADYSQGKDIGTVTNDVHNSEDNRCRYIDIAYAKAKGVRDIEKVKDIAKVEYNGDIVIVTFPIPSTEIKRPPSAIEGTLSPPYPGPDFRARVTMDRHTDEILEMRVAQ